MTKSITREEVMANLFTYDDLAERWDRPVQSVRIMQAQGRFQSCDFRIGRTPIWTLATVEQMEADKPTLNKRKQKEKEIT